MQTHTVAIDSLIADPANPREHSDENVAVITASLQRFGQVLPLVVHAESGMVIGGNATRQAMKALGYETCEIVCHEGTAEEARALSVMLNRSAELADWDTPNYLAALDTMHGLGFTMPELGYGAGDLGDMLQGLKYEGQDDDTATVPPTADETPAPDPIGVQPVAQYNLIFDNADQQARWVSFTRWLKKSYPDYGTGAERLDALVVALMARDDDA